MKKSKGQTIDLLYTNKKETNNKTSKKRKPAGANSVRPMKKKNTNTKKNQNNKNDIINLDNEIIIGLTPKKEETKKDKKSTKTKKKPVKDVGASNARPQKGKKANSKKKATNKKQNPKKKRKNKIIKWIILGLLLLTVIVLFLMSSVFNIREIVVVNNSKISCEEIINLSTLTTGVNMFKTTNGEIKNGIKTSAYIEDVNVKRNINGIVTLDVKERIATYMLNFENTYAYINNQGYILEISEIPLELPLIKGFSTATEEIKEGNRLSTQDLIKLDDIIKIIEASKNTSLANLITIIDVLDSTNYRLTIESQGKTVILEDIANINIKLQMAGKVFEVEEGKKGEIYFQENGKKAVFKEEVSR